MNSDTFHTELMMKSLLETVDFTFEYNCDNSETSLKTCAKAQPEKKKRLNAEDTLKTFNWDRTQKADYIRRMNEAEETRKEEMKNRQEKRRIYRDKMREMIINGQTPTLCEGKQSLNPVQDIEIDYPHIKGIYGPKRSRHGPESIK